MWLIKNHNGTLYCIFNIHEYMFFFPKFTAYCALKAHYVSHSSSKRNQCLYFVSIFFLLKLKNQLSAFYCLKSIVHFVIKLFNTITSITVSLISSVWGERGTEKTGMIGLSQLKGCSIGLLLTTPTRAGSVSMQQRAGDHSGPLNYNQ